MLKRPNPQPLPLPVIVIFVTGPSNQADKADKHGVYPPDFTFPGFLDTRSR